MLIFRSFNEIYARIRTVRENQGKMLGCKEIQGESGKVREHCL